MDELRLEQEPLKKGQGSDIPSAQPMAAHETSRNLNLILIPSGGRSPARTGQAPVGPHRPGPQPSTGTPSPAPPPTQIHLISLPKPFLRGKVSANTSLKQLLPQFSSSQSTKLNHLSLGQRRGQSVPSAAGTNSRAGLGWVFPPSWMHRAWDGSLKPKGGFMGASTKGGGLCCELGEYSMAGRIPSPAPSMGIHGESPAESARPKGKSIKFHLLQGSMRKRQIGETFPTQIKQPQGENPRKDPKSQNGRDGRTRARIPSSLPIQTRILWNSFPHGR